MRHNVYTWKVLNSWILVEIFLWSPSPVVATSAQLLMSSSVCIRHSILILVLSMHLLIMNHIGSHYHISFFVNLCLLSMVCFDILGCLGWLKCMSCLFPSGYKYIMRFSKCRILASPMGRFSAEFHSCLWINKKKNFISVL